MEHHSQENLHNHQQNHVQDFIISLPSQIPDEPSVDGFTRHNSLLEMNRLQVLGGRTLTTAAPGDAAVEDDDGLHLLQL